VLQILLIALNFDLNISVPIGFFAFSNLQASLAAGHPVTV